MSYYVSVQRQWPDGFEYIEVTAGGLDSMGSGAEARPLGPFDDPRDAAAAAVQLRNERHLPVVCGSGFDIAGVGDDEGTGNRGAILAWGEREYQAMPECPGCGERFASLDYQADDWSGIHYCEGCAAREAEYQERAANAPEWHYRPVGGEIVFADGRSVWLQGEEAEELDAALAACETESAEWAILWEYEHVAE